MSTRSRFKRIARDLEKLPCELHEPVLADLEFEQLIRLSQSAGPLLIWSLEHSPSLWAQFFRDGAAKKWQKYLACTDQVKALCFKPEPEKGRQPLMFEEGTLSFLHHRSADWSSQRTYRFHRTYLDRVSLQPFWYGQIYETIMSMKWMEFRQEDSGLGQWISKLESGRSASTGKDKLSLREIFEEIAVGGSVQPYTYRPARLSVDDVITFIDAYQHIRRIRADALAGELRRLADLYDAHPTRVKMPFAPQTRRPNEKHVPDNLRSEARIMVGKAKYTRWTPKLPFRSRFGHSFPALVPYDWCLRLFVKALRKHDLADSIYPRDIVKKCVIIAETPSWVLVELRRSQSQADAVGDASRAFKLLDLDSGNLDRVLDLTKRTDSEKYAPHTDAELVWLETFMAVVAWMETQFPDLVQEVRGSDWHENLGRQPGRWATKKTWKKHRKEDALKKERED